MRSQCGGDTRELCRRSVGRSINSNKNHTACERCGRAKTHRPPPFPPWLSAWPTGPSIAAAQPAAQQARAHLVGERMHPIKRARAFRTGTIRTSAARFQSRAKLLGLQPRTARAFTNETRCVALRPSASHKYAAQFR